MKKLLLGGLLIASAALMGIASNVASAEIINTPLFNRYTDVAGIGDEKDFLRALNADGSTVNTKEICSGEGKLWMYVHNGQGTQNNDDTSKPGAYDGIGVARDTRVKLSLPGTYTNSTTATGTISASNAPTVTDTAFVTCGSKKVKVEFVAVESVKTTHPTGKYTLTGDITSGNGALLSFDGNNGVVPGCWDYRALITIKVRVVEEPPKPVPQTLVCTTMNEPVITDRAKRTVSVGLNTGTASGGASISGYKIDWGDGTVTNGQNGSHSYGSDGVKNITGYVVGTLDGKATSVTSAGCKKSVKFETTVEKKLFCDGVTIEKLGGRKVRATVKASVSGGAKVSKYTFNFNNEKTNVVDSDALSASSEYTFASDGTKKVVVTVSGTAADTKCEATVTLTTDVPPVTPKPEVLPTTGVGGALGLFVGSSVLGGIGYRAWAIRRLNR